MKKSLSLFVLMLISSMAIWAQDVTAVTLQDDGGTKYVNMPRTGTSSLTLTDASVSFIKVYDDGGKYIDDNNRGYYSNYCDGYLILTAPAGYNLQVSGTISSETCDYLTIYDGTTTEADQLLKEKASSPNNGDVNDIGYITSTGQSIMLFFHSDYSSVFAGLDLDIIVCKPDQSNSITIKAAQGGVLHSDKSTAKFGETVTLTWTHEPGYVLESISVKDAYGRDISIVGGSWFNAATSFTMPISAATVTPKFIKATTSLDGLAVNIPKTGTRNCDIATGVTSFKVYDHGGPDGQFGNNIDGYLLVTVPAGLRLQVTGKVLTTESQDYLTIYDGTTTEASILLNEAYKTDNIGIITSSTENLLLRFYSDNSNVGDGLDLELTLFDPNEAFPVDIVTVTGGALSSDKATAKFDETVTLTESHDAGYILKEISVIDINGRKTEVIGGNWHNVVGTFSMPASKVTVTPTFMQAATIDDGLFINIPKTETFATNISTGVKSFKVYEHGGKDGQYEDGCEGYLVLNVPAGYRMQLTGTVAAEAGCDKLYVYDGDTKEAAVLLNGKSSESVSSGKYDATDIGVITSTGNSMTLHFHSDGSQHSGDGLDLNVYVFNPEEPHTITIETVEGGAMTSDMASAKFDETITLTKTNQRGYALLSTTAKDANGTPIEVTGGTWYNEAATFPMSIADATVTPTFTTATTAEEGLFINMPKEGIMTTAITNGIKSFYVYDDGGSKNSYSNNCKGTLVLTAPIGYRIQLTGTIASENGYDKISIYDGAEASGTPLLDGKSSTTSHHEESIGEFLSTARSLTLYFESDGSNNNGYGLNLKATLIPIKYTLAFDNGKDGATGTMEIAGAMESIELTYDDPKTLPALAFSRTAYDFMGWALAADGEVKFADKAEVENLATEQGATVTIYAKWKPIVYPITYDLAKGAMPEGKTNPAEYTVETPDFTLINPARVGYTFTGWEGTDLATKTVNVTVTTGHYGNRSYTATWEPNPYYVRFDKTLADGTETMADQQFFYDAEQALTANAYTRTGYTFKEWRSKADGTGTKYDDKQVVGNLTTERDAIVKMYAQWTPNPYQVRFNANNGTGTMANQNFIYDTEQALIQNVFSRKGYTYEGWNTKADGSGTGYADKASVKNLTAELNGIVDIYAQWKVITYTIGYTLNGGTVATANPATYNVETETFTLVNPTRTGYIFDGWTGTDLTEATKTVTIAKGSIGNRTFTANWTPIVYNIAYDLAGGSVADGSSVSSYTIETPTFTLTNPTKAHWVFTGWTGTGLSTASTDVTIAKGSIGDRSYTATWEREVYTVDITSNNDDLVSASTTSPKYEDDVVLTFTADDDWDLISLTVDGTDVTSAISSGKYTIANVSANVSVNVTYKANKAFIHMANPQATFSCTEPLDFSEVPGLKAFIANGYQNGKVLMTRVASVPANTGLLLVGEAGMDYKVPFAPSSAFYINLLKPVTEDQVVPQTDGDFTNFLLGKKDDVIGFYISSGTGTVAAGKAYLQLPTDFVGSIAHVKGISITFDDETIINDIPESEHEIDGVYDMAGRKVADTFDAKKLPVGVYIVNGKKIVVK